MKEIYFDNSATTKVLPEACEAAVMMMRGNYYNPSSLHGKGVLADRILTGARQSLASILKVDEREIYFTSGGSEGNNTALFGVAEINRKKGKKILISQVEHPSVLESAKALASRGFDIEMIPVNKWGKIDLETLKGLLTPEVILVSVQHVNNENGVIQPLPEISALIKEKAPDAVFHVDGVQAFLKIDLDITVSGIDIYTVSGHKIHGPKGIGLLYVKKDVRFLPLIYGGGQERAMRSGTENMPGIAAFRVAAENVYALRQENYVKVKEVRDTLIKELQSKISDCHINTPLSESSPYILNVSFPGVKSEMLLHYLEEKDVYVSSGSACHSRKDIKSHVLMAMGLPDEIIDSAIRYSFSIENTIGEAMKAAEITALAVNEIRAFYNINKKNKR